MKALPAPQHCKFHSDFKMALKICLISILPCKTVLHALPIYARVKCAWIVSEGCILIHVCSSLIMAGEGILPYLPTLMEKLLLALSPSTVSILKVALKEKSQC